MDNKAKGSCADRIVEEMIGCLIIGGVKNKEGWDGEVLKKK